jgi:hypothetical protein
MAQFLLAFHSGRPDSLHRLPQADHCTELHLNCTTNWLFQEGLTPIEGTKRHRFSILLQKQFKHGYPQILNLETGDWSVESGEQSAKDRASSPRLLQIIEPREERAAQRTVSTLCFRQRSNLDILCQRTEASYISWMSMQSKYVSFDYDAKRGASKQF